VPVLKFLLFGVFAIPLYARAQQPTNPPAGSNWQHVQALPIGTSISVKSKIAHKNCALKSVDADTLTCTHSKDFVFPRAEILSITIPRRGRSTLIAAAAGVGVGAVIGAATYKPCTTAEKQSFLGCIQFLSRGDLALIGGTMGLAVAAPIGFFTNFAHSTVYKAP
jgi:hypothetical protein